MEGCHENKAVDDRMHLGRTIIEWRELLVNPRSLSRLSISQDGGKAQDFASNGQMFK